MEIISNAVVDGHFEDKYGKRTKIMFDGVPSLSIPFEIINAPKDTQSFALVLEDKDAIPVAGFTWIHWLAANILDVIVPENASRNDPNFIQGRNSWDMDYYGGMMPPNAPHKYDLHVYALDKILDLQNDFTKKELEKEMDGHILAKSTLSAMYSDK